MKKGIIVVLFLIGILIASMIIFTDRETSPEDWPTPENMIENLQKKRYTITEDTKIQLGDVEYTGRVIIGEKGSEIVTGFWAEDNDVAKAVYDYWRINGRNEYALRVGTTIYWGTKRALKHAGINVKKIDL